MRAPLRHRPFRLLFLAQCASFLGDAIFIVAITFAVLEIAGSAAALGTVLAAGSAMLVFTFLFSGVWADRLPRLRIMIASDLVRVASQSILAALLLLDRAELWHLFVLYGVYSIATAFFQPARTALTPQLLEPHLLMSGNGLMATAENLMWTIGWAVAGLLVAWIGVGWAIAIDALTFAASAALLLTIGRVPAAARGTSDEPSSDSGAFLRELRDGWREMAGHRWLWFTIANATIFLLVYEAPLQVVGPITMEASYSGASSWGILLAGAGAGATIGAVISATRRLPRQMLVAMCLFFACVLMPVLLLLEAPLWALVVCNVVVGLAFGLFDTIWNSTIQHRVPADRVARVSAWDWMGSMAGMPLGFALAGVLVEWVGRTPTLTIMAITTFLLCVVFMSDPQLRRLGEDLPRARSSSESDSMP